MRIPKPQPRRSGSAAVELAVVLPFLCFMFVISIDYARIFYFSLTMEHAARNGAYFASDYPGLYSYTSADQYHANARRADQIRNLGNRSVYLRYPDRLRLRRGESDLDVSVGYQLSPRAQPDCAGSILPDADGAARPDVLIRGRPPKEIFLCPVYTLLRSALGRMRLKAPSSCP